jgi:hypothetical protein
MTVDLRRWPTPVEWINEPLHKALDDLYPSGTVRNVLVDTVHAWMMGLAYYESRGNPDAINRRVYDDPWLQARGTFQHMPKYWSGRSPDRTRGRLEYTITTAGRLGVDLSHLQQYDDPLATETGLGILNPTANIYVAAYVFDLSGPLAWSPARTVWPFEAFRVSRTRWFLHDDGYWVPTRTDDDGRTIL